MAGISAGLVLAAVGIDAAIAQEIKRYAMFVRVLGNTAFELTRIRAQEAADEIGIELIYTGPTENTAEGQVALTPSLTRAMQRGIKVVTGTRILKPMRGHCTSRRPPIS